MRMVAAQAGKVLALLFNTSHANSILMRTRGMCTTRTRIGLEVVLIFGHSPQKFFQKEKSLKQASLES